MLTRINSQNSGGEYDGPPLRLRLRVTPLHYQRRSCVTLIPVPSELLQPCSFQHLEMMSARRSRLHRDYIQLEKSPYGPFLRGSASAITLSIVTIASLRVSISKILGIASNTTESCKDAILIVARLAPFYSRQE